MSLSRDPLGNLGGARLLGILRDNWRAPEEEHLSLREFCKGYLERGSFSEDLEGYVEEGSEDGHHFPWGPR